MTFTKLLVLVHSSVLSILLFSFFNIIPLALVFKTCTLQETTSSEGGIFFFVSALNCTIVTSTIECVSIIGIPIKKGRDLIIVSFIFPGEKNQSNLLLTYNMMTYFRNKNDHYFYVCKSAIKVGWCYV